MGGDHLCSGTHWHLLKSLDFVCVSYIGMLSLGGAHELAAQCIAMQCDSTGCGTS